jgi:amino acid transporter
MRRLRLLPLIAATYFMVSGGPYGIEDAIGQAGYARTLLLLILVPLFWSLPTALMVGELASALPEEGGFYVWVSRGLGPFWGFQEAWLSLAASVFDMALYPALTVSYLGQIVPSLTAGHRGIAWSLGIIVLCALWNLCGASSVGQSSEWFSVLLVLPFLVMILLGIVHVFAHPGSVSEFRSPVAGNVKTALLVILWNYMGWDNASTIAREVDKPQRIYAPAVLATVALVSVTYIASVAAVATAGVPAAHFATGDWVAAARLLGGGGLYSQLFGDAVVLGGALTGIAMFNALTLSYARVPAAMAKDGLLPMALARHSKRGVPYLAVFVCCLAWASVSGLNFDRLIELDILLYGLSLVLEFAALIALRIRQPQLPRPYRIPGGIAGAIAVSVAPVAIAGWALLAARDEQIALGTFKMPVLLFGSIVLLMGMLIYWPVRSRLR